MSQMKISVFGCGYVGLVTGVCFAEVGYQVMLGDIQKDKIDALKQGQIPFVEPGLEPLLKRHLDNERLSFTCDLAKLVEADVICIATGTPSLEDGSADLQSIDASFQVLAEHMDGYRLILMKSTVPPGTSARLKVYLKEALAKQGKDCTFDIVSNPEFLREGTAVVDGLSPHRIVIGCEGTKARVGMSMLYAPWQNKGIPLLNMDPTSAELTKYAANTMLAARISMMNDLALLSERCGADIESVRLGLSSDPRLGNGYLYPGLGFGGSCLPKDLRAFIHYAQQLDCSMSMLRATLEINQRIFYQFMERVRQHFKNGLEGSRIALWGLTFKPNTSDLRESPAMALSKALLERGVHVTAYDPLGMDEAKLQLASYKNFSTSKDPYKALKGAQALCVATEWEVFRQADLRRIEKELAQWVVFDGRNIFDPWKMEQRKCRYYAIGRLRKDL